MFSTKTYEYLWLFIATAFFLIKVSQIWMSITAKAFLLLEVDFAGSTLKNTISTDTGEPDQPIAPAETRDFRVLQPHFPKHRRPRGTNC